jgi:hypothetical protein
MLSVRMRRGLVLMVGAMAGGVGLALGCGGSNAGVGGNNDSGAPARDGQGSVDAGDAGVSDAPWSPVCPVDVPPDGAACSVSTLTCEYGDSSEPVCNTFAQCLLEPPRFLVSPPAPNCPLPPPQNSPGCPASYADIEGGGPCSNSATSGGECWYPDGQCDCIAGPTGTGETWTCMPQPAACPATPPRMGAPCSSPGIACNYYSCQIAGAAALCLNGVWHGGPGGCLVPAVGL